MDCDNTPAEYLDRVYNTDCIAGMSRLPDGCVDMILCDLPYGITACRWDSIIPFDALWDQYLRVIKDNGAIVLTGCQPFTTRLIQSNPKLFRYCWYWRKNMVTGFANANRQPLKCVEDVCVFYRRLPTYNPQGLIHRSAPKLSRGRKAVSPGDSTYRADGSLSHDTYSHVTNYPRQMLEFKCERGLHPTQKPVALFEYLIRTYTNPGETVLDNCMGSGTTAVACLRSGRHYVGYEIDERYYQTTTKRIEEERCRLSR